MSFLDGYRLDTVELVDDEGNPFDESIHAVVRDDGVIFPLSALHSIICAYTDHPAVFWAFMQQLADLGITHDDEAASHQA